MLREIAKIFETEYNEKGREDNKDYMISVNHIPEDGDYVLLEELEDGYKEFERIIVKKDKKTNKVETNNPYFDFIRSADYMSRYLESNKAIKDKNIHSNNYLTLFIKKENLFNGKINDNVLTEYYEVFRNPYNTKYKNPPIRSSYEAAEHKYGVSNVERINKIEKWVKENLFNLCLKSDKTYLKLFFYCDDLEVYRKESEKYILTNIFNCADYNVVINDKIYGLPNNNNDFKSKKPYFEQRTRKNTVPFLISQEEVLLQKKLFDHLKNISDGGNTNLYINEEKGISVYDNKQVPEEDFSGYFMRVQKGMETEIHDFDTIVNFTNGRKPIQIRNVLEIENSNIQYEKVYTLNKMKDIINKTLFRGYLINNYFTEVKDMNIEYAHIKRNIILSRNALFNWFYKGIENGVWVVLKKSSLDLIKGSIFSNHIISAREQYNLYKSLKIYFENEESENIMMDVNTLREKVNSKITSSIESDSEYFFAVGQLANYFLSLSKAKVKRHSLSNSILNAKSDAKIKSELNKLFFKYNNETQNNRRFNNLYSMINGYYPKDRVDVDSLIRGYLHSSLIYEKSNKENSDESIENINSENE